MVDTNPAQPRVPLAGLDVHFALVEVVLVGTTWTAVYKAAQYIGKMRTAGGKRR